MKSLKALLIYTAIAFTFLIKVEALETIEPGIVRVAVTGIPEENQDNAPSWTLDFFNEFKKTYQLDIQFVVSGKEKIGYAPING